VYSAVDVGGIGTAGLGVILWLFSKAVLVGVLVLVHLIQRRWRSVPAPLFDRRTPVGARTRLGEGAVGVGAGYALCVAVFFVAMLGQPTGTSLFLEPVDDGPAARAGVVHGDRARSVEGRPVKTFEEFRDGVARAPETVSIEVERKGRGVPLRIRKDQDNRIGVAPLPGEAMGAATAAARAVAAPAAVLTEWLRMSLHLISGDAAGISGPVGIAVAASRGPVQWTNVLAWLMTKDFGVVVFIYLVVLVADTRSRSRYQATPASSAPAP